MRPSSQVCAWQRGPTNSSHFSGRAVCVIIPISSPLHPTGDPVGIDWTRALSAGCAMPLFSCDVASKRPSRPVGRVSLRCTSLQNSGALRLSGELQSIVTKWIPPCVLMPSSPSQRVWGWSSAHMFRLRLTGALFSFLPTAGTRRRFIIDQISLISITGDSQRRPRKGLALRLVGTGDVSQQAALARWRGCGRQ